MQDLIGTMTAKVLAIIGVVAALAIGILAYARNDIADMHSTIAQIHQVLYPMHRYTSGRFGTAVITDANIVTWQAVPDSAVFSATEIRNPWDGAITVTGATDALHIDTDNIPQDACVKLVTEIPTSSVVRSVGIASTLAGVAGATQSAVPMTPTAATTACAASQNAIRFVVGK
jgi:hypothetical protein